MSVSSGTLSETPNLTTRSAQQRDPALLLRKHQAHARLPQDPQGRPLLAPYPAPFADRCTVTQALYSSDVLSDQAIIYWHGKGAKPQAKATFLASAEPLVNFLKAQEDDESDDDDE